MSIMEQIVRVVFSFQSGTTKKEILPKANGMNFPLTVKKLHIRLMLTNLLLNLDP